MNEFLLYSDIGGRGITSQQFADAFASFTGDVTVRINTRGGATREAFAMFSTVQRYDRGTVTAYIDGGCYSAGTILLPAFDRVVMSELGLLMYHPPRIAEGGTASQLEKRATELRTIHNQMVTAYESKTKQPRQVVESLVSGDDTYLTAEDAKKLGIVDEIIKPSEITNESFEAETWADERRPVVLAMKNQPNQITTKIKPISVEVKTVGTENQETQAATLAELQTITKDNSFIVEQMAAGATVAAAQQAWNTVLQTRLDEQEAAAAKREAELQKELADAQATAGHETNEPLGAGGAADDETHGETTAVDQFEQELQTRIARMNSDEPHFRRRRRAVEQVARHKPDLHQAYLREINAGDGQALRMLDEKFSVEAK